MNDDIAIRVSDLTKIYKLYGAPIDRMKEALHWRGKKYHKDFYALKNISFEVRKGETVGIIGKNGSGKSTLLKIITGVLSQSSGNILVNGRVSALLELGAGFNYEYTGIENIYFQGNLMGFSKEEMTERLPLILEFADIGDFIEQPVKMYSSGMFARLAFAVAINVEPDILIVDEALSVGDARFQNKCLSKISAMQKSGVTIFFVSHSTLQINSICTSAIWLDSGEIKAIGAAQDVVSLYIFDQNKGERQDIQCSNQDPSVLIQEEKSEWRNSVVEIMKDNKDAKLLGYRLLNEFGQSTFQIKAPGVYDLEVKYSINNDLMMPFAVFVLENILGEPIIKFNSIQLDHKLEKFIAGSILVVRTRLSIPDLATGDYFVKFSLHNGDMYSNEAILNIKLFNFEYTRIYKQDGYISSEAYMYLEYESKNQRLSVL